ncbi:hypothetical protein H4582DRAFT_2073286 [Lactarius indigo]|nr:hypothetical protein H4582DRAFT_2073286 [Lactarius indigo]
MSGSSRKYYCDCEARCKGQRKEVSRTTFYGHKKHRNTLSQFTPNFQEFLRNLGPSTPEQSLAPDNARKRANRSAAGPSGKCPRRQIDVTPEPDGDHCDRDTDQSHGYGASEDLLDPEGTQTPDHLGPEPQDAPGETGPRTTPEPGSLGVHVGPPHDDHSGAAGAVDLDSDLWDPTSIRLEDHKLTADFIRLLQAASLDDPVNGLSIDELECLRSPPRDRPADLVNDDSRFAIDLYLGNPSAATYEINRTAILRRFPDTSLPSYYRTKRLVSELTGIEPIVHDMCINSCLAYTGPFSGLESCPMCSEARYDQYRLEASSGRDKIPRQRFHTIPIGPQLQALYVEAQN